jgi:hypothetical protein
MNRNPSHQKKTTDHMRVYTRAIRRQNYEPTIDETIPFNDTTTAGEDLSQPTLARRRPINVKALLLDHFRENWVQYAVGILLVVGTYFMIDSKVNFARIFENIQFHSSQIESLKIDVKDINKDNVRQDLKIQANEIRVEQAGTKK